jgi:hypothetical protein
MRFQGWARIGLVRKVRLWGEDLLAREDSMAVSAGGIGLPVLDGSIHAPSDAGLSMARFSVRNGDLFEAVLAVSGASPFFRSNQTRGLLLSPTVVFVSQMLAHISLEVRGMLWDHMGTADLLVSESVVTR